MKDQMKVIKLAFFELATTIGVGEEIVMELANISIVEAGCKDHFFLTRNENKQE